MLRFTRRRFLRARIFDKPVTDATEVVAAITAVRSDAPVGSLFHARPDKLNGLLLAISSSIAIGTYFIMMNWIYNGYCDLWDGTYGVDDEDDDD